MRCTQTKIALEPRVSWTHGEWEEERKKSNTVVDFPRSSDGPLQTLLTRALIRFSLPVLPTLNQRSHRLVLIGPNPIWTFQYKHCHSIRAQTFSRASAAAAAALHSCSQFLPGNIVDNPAAARLTDEVPSKLDRMEDEARPSAG